jgi:hypothetical protein
MELNKNEIKNEWPYINNMKSMEWQKIYKGDLKQE